MPNFANAAKFMSDVKAEASRITWPKWKDTRTMTVMVFILATLIAIFLVGVDIAIGAGLKALFNI